MHKVSKKYLDIFQILFGYFEQTDISYNVGAAALAAPFNAITKTKYLCNQLTNKILFLQCRAHCYYSINSLKEKYYIL